MRPKKKETPPAGDAWSIEKLKEDLDLPLPFQHTTIISSAPKATPSKVVSPSAPSRTLSKDSRRPGRANAKAASTKSISRRRQSLNLPRPATPGRFRARDIDIFFASQWHGVEAVPKTGITEDLPSTAIWGRWGEHRRTLGIDNMHGCTSLVVLSPKGYFLSHYFEQPSFRAHKGCSLPTKTQDQIFARQVLDTLVYDLEDPETGHVGAPPLRALKDDVLPDGSSGPIFTDNEKVNVLIFTPARRHEQPAEETVCYPKYVQAIAYLVESMLPNASVRVVDYYRPYKWRDAPPMPERRTRQQQADFEDFMRRTAAGKVLVEYSPSAERFLKGYNVWGPRQYKGTPLASERWFML